MEKLLSFLSLESIIKYLDVDKRIALTLEHPSMRTIEKSVPLELRELVIGSSEIRIDDKSYEISGNSDVVTVAKIWRREEMNKIRIAFLKALEEYSEDRTYRMNPLNPWINFHGPDIVQFENEVNEVFLTITGSSQASFVRALNGQEVNENWWTVNVNNDELPRTCRKASGLIRELHHKIQRDFKNCGPDLSTIYSKLATMMIRTLERLSSLERAMFDPQNEEIQTPEGLTIGQQFKDLSSILFGGRKLIRVEKLVFFGDGIRDLPVSMRISANFCHTHCWSKSTIYDKFNTILKTVIHISVRDTRLLHLPVVQNCKVVHMKMDHLVDLPYLPTELPNVCNSFICIGLFIDRILNFNEFVDSWSRSENAKLRGKLIFGVLKGRRFRIGDQLKQGGFRERIRASKKQLFRSIEDNKEMVFHCVPFSMAAFRHRKHLQYDMHYLLEIANS